MATYRAPYESTGPGATENRNVDDINRTDTEKVARRLGSALIGALVCLVIGFWLGWSNGRNNLLETTYVRNGELIEVPAQNQRGMDITPAQPSNTVPSQPSTVMPSQPGTTLPQNSMPGHNTF